MIKGRFQSEDSDAGELSVKPSASRSLSFERTHPGEEGKWREDLEALQGNSLTPKRRGKRVRLPKIDLSLEIGSQSWEEGRDRKAPVGNADHPADAAQ